MKDQEDYTLEPLEQAELNEVIRKHQMFLTAKPGGARAVIRDRDLTGLSFMGQNLSQSDFSGCIMAETDLRNANFESATLFGCDLSNAKISNTKLVRADMRGADVESADLTKADLTGADLREGKTILKRKIKKPEDQYDKARAGAVHFNGSILSGAILNGATAISADFSDAIMTDVKMHGINLKNALLRHTDMKGSDLSGGDLRDADFHGAVMTDTNIEHTETGGTDFTLTLTDDTAGRDFGEMEMTLDELVMKHTAWVASAGREGKQLDLTEIDMRKAGDLSGQRLTAIKAIRTTFGEMDLRGVEMQGGVLDQSDFRKCQLNTADMRGSSFKGAIFNRAILRDANMLPLLFKKPDGVDFTLPCNFEGASFRHADMSGARLMSANFKNADLSYADFSNCDLRKADFTGADLTNAKFDGAALEDAVFP